MFGFFTVFRNNFWLENGKMAKGQEGKKAIHFVLWRLPSNEVKGWES